MIASYIIILCWKDNYFWEVNIMSSRLTIALPEELKEQINELAKKKNINASNLIRMVMTEYVERENLTKEGSNK